MGNWDAWLLEGFPRAQDDPMRRFVEQGEWWARSVSADDRAFVRTFVPQLELQTSTDLRPSVSTVRLRL